MNRIFQIFRRVFSTVVPRRLPIARVYVYQFINRWKDKNDTRKQRFNYQAAGMLNSYVKFADYVVRAGSRTQGLKNISIRT